MNIKNAMILVCVLFLFLPLYACSQQKSFPTGTFTSENGNWTIIFSEDGSYTVTGTSEITSGTFSIKGGELTWETDTYCDAFNAGKATYTWKYKNDILTMNVKGNDKCEGRQAVLEDISYLKKP